jgi:hypothetical protein
MDSKTIKVLIALLLGGGSGPAASSTPSLAWTDRDG